jgi:hypothetical protein
VLVHAVAGGGASAIVDELFTLTKETLEASKTTKTESYSGITIIRTKLVLRLSKSEVADTERLQRLLFIISHMVVQPARIKGGLSCAAWSFSTARWRSSLTPTRLKASGAALV